MNRTDWSLASCGNSEIDWVEPHPARVADLAVICGGCPIQRACARLALQLLDPDERVDLVGMWAGAWLPPTRRDTRERRLSAIEALRFIVTGVNELPITMARGA